MHDLFHFVRDLLRNDAEVCAAFVVGIVVAIIFLAPTFYWLFNRIYGNLWERQKAAEAEVADLKRKLDEVEKKAKTRKARLDEKQTEVASLTATVTEARQKADQDRQSADDSRQKLANLQEEYGKIQKQLEDRTAEYFKLVPKYNRLAGVAMSLKKQVVAQEGDAKRFEKLQAQLWDVPVDSATVTPFRPLTRDRAVILTLLNLKGGVGKTTLTANLAATYANLLKKRVLVVDLDFQASLTGLCLPPDLFGRRKVGIDEIFKDPTAAVAEVAYRSVLSAPEKGLSVLSCSEELPAVEERAKANWLLKPGESDLRSVFRRVFHDAKFQDDYDVILIDPPPRWSPASINAIACSDYVLIPTTLDRVSSEAVPRLLKWLRNLKASAPELYKEVEVLGVLGNRVYPRSKMIATEDEIWRGLPPKCVDVWGLPVHHFATIVQEKGEIHRAANQRKFAALESELKDTFLTLVEEIETRRRHHEGR